MERISSWLSQHCSMLPLKTQVYYWAFSAAAVVAYRIFEQARGLQDCWQAISVIFFVLIGNALITENDLNTARRTLSQDKLFNFSLATCMASLGHLARYLRGGFLQARDDNPVAREDVLHLLLAYILLAKAWYYYSGISKSTFLIDSLD